MNRIHCLLAAALTFVLALWLVEQTKAGTSLSPREMIASRGGSAFDAKCNGRCDDLSGLYVGCTQVGDSCTQCANAQGVTTYADYIDMVGVCGGLGGYQYGQQAQNCGDIWSGTCISDPNSPTGFTCQYVDTMNVCTNGLFNVVPQP
jgi:hypothetical protein